MKKLYITLGFAILILICAGCSQQQNTKKTTGTETNKPKDQETQIQEEEQEEKTEELVVFYGDEQAEFVIKKKVQVLKITKEEILLQLEKAGVIKSGIKLNSCHTEKIDEKNVLVLDFSKEFSDQLKEMGTSGERIMMGSVVNTFLTAYDKEYVTVTVNGKTIESGHTAYEGFLKFFKPGLQSSLELPVSREGKEVYLEFTRQYCELGFSICYLRKEFKYEYQEDEKIASFYPKDEELSDSGRAFLAVSISEYDFQKTVEGLSTQASTDKVEQTQLTLGEDSLETTRLSFQDAKTPSKTVNYYVTEHNSTVYIIETNIDQAKQDGYDSVFDVMLSTFRFVD